LAFFKNHIYSFLYLLGFVLFLQIIYYFLNFLL